MKSGKLALTLSKVGLDGDILAALTNAVTPVRPATGSLGSLAVACMAGFAALSVVVVDFGAAKVSLFTASGASAVTAVASAGSTVNPISLTPGDDSKSSSPIAITNDSDASLVGSVAPAAVTDALALALDAIFGPGPSSKSVAGMIDGVDTALADPTVGKQGFLVIDQTAKTVELFVMDSTAEITSIADGSASSGDFVATFEVDAPVTPGAGFFKI